ncbi:MAG: flagellar basal body L-ring protein FlgH [Pirellulaceae bacterium]|nr:flagellar basal body L-ring protein FlgH [Planctomycetales bacterium]MCA9263970.1 flagellar basal body L-ring protein FlgH [Planctomycetales bacterium]
MKLKTTILSVLLVSSALTIQATGQSPSLYARRVASRGPLFHDTQARRVGDTLTVIVSESTDAAMKDDRQMDRNSTTGGGFDFSASSGGDLGSKTGTMAMDTSANSSGTVDNSSQYSVARDFTDRIAVMIVDKTPNGDFVIRGQRSITVSGEHRTLTINGIVRFEDIRADNTVLSQYIANLDVCYAGDGAETIFTKPGWMARTWDLIRPF